MIDKFKKAIQDASETLREQAANLGEGAKEKTYQLIEEWLQVFPKLEIYGLEMTSFSLAVALSPALEVELKGAHEKFPKERLDEIIQENRRNAALVSVFTTIRTTYNLHRRTYANLNDPLIVKIRIRLSPEIKVYIGKPVIE
ncbi:MAG: hypothetical protein H6558_06785 [Lewinellaceae bacterium]|nr:hypothetical protein [Lewinellaceae bacterium]